MKTNNFEIIKKEGSKHILYHDSRIVKINRYERNDCWNVALSLACNEPYEIIRKRFKNFISTNGGMKRYRSVNYLKRYKYELFKNDYKTINQLADDTENTKYEYIAYVSGHVVYIRHGYIYDSYNTKYKRINEIYRRKISNNRKPIHDYFKKNIKEVL